MTTVARTLLDQAGELSSSALERLVHDAEVRGMLDPGEMRDVLARANGRKGVAVLRALLPRATDDLRSELERRFRETLAKAGIPAPRFNLPLDIGGHRMLGDAVWTDARLIAELDGFVFHRTRYAFEADRERDQRLAAAGWLVIRVTWRQLEHDPLGVMSRITHTLAARG